VSESAGTAKVSWTTELAGPFTVTALKGETAVKKVENIEPTAPYYYTFTELEPGSYTFKVECKVEEETYSGITKEAVAVGIAKPVVAAYSAYESVALEWDAVPFADHYDVYMDGALKKEKAKATKAYDSEKLSYVVTKVTDEKDHDFYVVAVAADGITKAQSDTVNDGAIKRMYITIKFNQNRRLTSHDKYKKSYSFKTNQQVKAHGFGGGKYKFYYTVKGKECLFYVSFLRTKGAKAIYNKNKKDNWSSKEAEYFINTAKQGSKTKYYFWVSQYAQHVYVFTGKKGSWRLYDDWDCSTGAAATPSPVGFGKKIYKKTANRHGLGPWTSFQSWTSFHGSKKSWKKLWGKPVSHACIRCPSDKAMWIYKKVPLKTAVGVY
jgi:lipoprotein-anchoring transpeptidase ErfK/SrfK